MTGADAETLRWLRGQLGGWQPLADFWCLAASSAGTTAGPVFAESASIVAAAAADVAQMHSATTSQLDDYFTAARSLDAFNPARVKMVVPLRACVCARGYRRASGRSNLAAPTTTSGSEQQLLGWLLRTSSKPPNDFSPPVTSIQVG